MCILTHANPFSSPLLHFFHTLPAHTLPGPPRPFFSPYLLSFVFAFVAFEPAPGPVPCTSFNRTGTIFAYAVSYDWSKGHSGMTPGHPNKLMLHACKDEEVKRKPAKR